MTLDGNVVMTIPGTEIPDQFKIKDKDGKINLRLSGLDVGPAGRSSMTM